MERQIQSLQFEIPRHGVRLVIFLLVGILASVITREWGGRLDTQIMIGSAFVAILGGGHVFKYY